MAFNGRFILNLANLASKQGAQLPELIQLCGKSFEELTQEDCIVEDNNYNRVVEKVVESTNDPLFGLHAGEHLNLSAAGLMFQLVQNSKNVKQAYELCCQFANLGCSALPMNLTEEPKGYKLTFTPNQLWKNDSNTAYKHTVLGILSFQIRAFHSLTFMLENPLEVNLNWGKQTGIEEIENVLGCSVNLNQPELSIYFNKKHFDTPIISSNYDLLQTLIVHAEKLSAKKNKEGGFSNVVAQTIISLVKPEFPAIEKVAAQLNLSTRTLQRKLNLESNSFKSISENLKKEFALGYIKNPNLNISDIAYLLGYSEVSTFTRSFKRWTGTTPMNFRKTM